MDPFPQTVVNAPGVPSTLRPSLYRSAGDLSKDLNSLIARRGREGSVLGISILLTADESLLEAVAFATDDDIFVLYPRAAAIQRNKKEVSTDADALLSLLYGQGTSLVGFGMARIAIHIRKGLNTHMRGIELSEAVMTKDRKLSPGTFVRNYVDHNANTFAVDTVWDALPAELKDDPKRLEYLCLRAWVSARVAAHSEVSRELNTCTAVDTIRLSGKYFNPIHQMLAEVEQMEAAKPRMLENEFSSVDRLADGKLVINNERFKNRVRPSETTAVHLVDEEDNIHYGVATSTYGKQTHVTPTSNTGPRIIKRICVVGKEELGHSDRARDAFLLQLLQGRCVLHDPAYELILKLYFPSVNDSPPQKIVGANRHGRLNQSQADVVEAMVALDSPFVLVHGPPGTGKTSTISAAVQEWAQLGKSTWVVAQSNVGVKNIAERLCKDGVNFRLLVSKEFFVEWHEHIYEEVKDSLIRTDELPSTPQEMAVVFDGVKVVLCTISTLSNPSVERKRVFSFVPMTNLVVDEASQIGIFSYMHIFAQFKRLHKVCFFGDPKQLPPYGQESAPTLQCIFDVRHLKPQAYFLNTQYRMPVPLGSFISTAVYNGKLRSEHKIKTPSCVTFIDVSFGVEEFCGKSFVNHREVQTITHLARYYYQQKNYCIITPYDAQRSELEKTLKAEGLRWDNVYNVDSFQGNEADFIIVSVVRSSAPGFLVSQNRVNVMLTRCKLGMVVVTSRSFMNQRRVKETLLGQLNQHWRKLCDSNDTWRDWKDVAEEEANLPGVSKRRGASAQINIPHGSSINNSQLPPVRRSRMGYNHVEDQGSPTVSEVSSPRSFSSGPGSIAEGHQGSPITASLDISLTLQLQRTRLRPGALTLRSASVKPSKVVAAIRSPLVNNRQNSYDSTFPELPSPPSPVLRTASRSAWSRGPPSVVSQKFSSRTSDTLLVEEPFMLKGIPVRAPSAASRRSGTSSKKRLPF
ncbi:hypothetical protein M0805_008461 [Coniferiporia weirii]|nr:hypothetical protein M0805_008461 [Coniferiporia weirii]